VSHPRRYSAQSEHIQADIAKREREQVRDAKRLATLAEHRADNPPKPISYDSLGGPDDGGQP
jgi:hypothetical protein